MHILEQHVPDSDPLPYVCVSQYHSDYVWRISQYHSDYVWCIQLIQEGKEDEAAELLTILEWAATAESKESAPVAHVAPAKPCATVEKKFTPQQVLQIEEATALIQQVPPL